MDGTGDGLSWIWHSLSVTALAGVLAGLITPIAAVATTVWFVVQVWESKTVQRYLRTRRERKISRMRAKLAELEDAQVEES